MENNNDPKSWVEEQMASLNADAGWTPDSARGWTLLQQRRRAAQTRERRWFWSLSAVAATAVCLMAFPLTRAFAQRCVSACVELAGFSLHTNDPFNSRFDHNRKLAPDFTLQDATGKAVKLSDFRGRVVLLNFWATWCGPCKVEIPWFIEFQQKYGRRGELGGLAVLGVSLDDDGWTSVKPYVEAKKMNYTVTVGNDDLSALYGGIEDLPTTLIIDKSGHIAAKHVGLCPRSYYESEIKGLLAE
jgi:thiol-disulfide isomerase/thioredoxin